jgi:carboxypeptidase Taq
VVGARSGGSLLPFATEIPNDPLSIIFTIISVMIAGEFFKTGKPLKNELLPGDKGKIISLTNPKHKVQSMENKLQNLKTILAEVSDLMGVSALLGWDQQTYMPKGGAVHRANQSSTIQKLAHVRFTSEEVGRLLEDLKQYAGELDPDSDDARLIKVTDRQYKKRTKVPTEWVGEFSQLTSNAHQVWVEARAENSFLKFKPSLEKIVEMSHQFAGFFTPYEHIYDPLLDNYEPGMKTRDVKDIFEKLRPQQVELVQAIKESHQVDNSFLHQNFDEQKQWDFGVEVITSFGYDWDRGRQDKAAHPFTTIFGINDVRITTRIMPDYLGSALFSTLHEAGHAMYEQGVAQELNRTPLASGCSLALHESQSRMWENLVGRSYEFWQYFYPRLQEYFPSQLKNVDIDTFYKGINRVEPSLIRVEADEATYNLHIMLRLELEIALMEGTIEVKDLPEVWNTRMEEYLGLMPPDDKMGVLQDVHWSSGYLGYFSTYALGNLVSVQLWDVIQKDNSAIKEQIRNGDFNQLLSWLRENIHHSGAKFEPQELVKRVTGSTINPDPYVNYLKDKYGRIYGL